MTNQLSPPCQNEDSTGVEFPVRNRRIDNPQDVVRIG